MIRHYSFKQFDVSALQKPKRSQSICGDSYFVSETDQYFIGTLVDGLGSGEYAKQASQIAVDTIAKESDSPVDELIQKVNESLINYRGVVLTIFKMNFQTKSISYCSIGNVQLVIFLPNGKRLMPLPNRGFLSGRPLKVRKEVYPYPDGAIFIIHSDGFKSSGEIKKINCDFSQEQLIYRIEQLFNKQSDLDDDVTILIGKQKAN